VYSVLDDYRTGVVSPDVQDGCRPKMKGSLPRRPQRNGTAFEPTNRLPENSGGINDRIGLDCTVSRNCPQAEIEHNRTKLPRTLQPTFVQCDLSRYTQIRYYSFQPSPTSALR
jgi:hypothetical protein